MSQPSRLRFRRFTRTLYVVILAGGCAQPDWKTRSEEIFRGRYANGWERSEFIPCGSSERWWLQPDSSSVGYPFQRRLVELSRDSAFIVRARQWRKVPPKDTLYVEARGVRSSKGRYGHLGGYDRELTMHKLVRLQREIPADCALAARTPPV